MNTTQTEALRIIKNAVDATKVYSTNDLPEVPDDITERLGTAAAIAHALYGNLIKTGCKVNPPSYPLVTAKPDDIRFWSFHAMEDFVNSLLNS